jgi:hypothetical protein
LNPPEGRANIVATSVDRESPVEADVSDQGESQGRLKRLSRVLSAPLLITVVGAVLAGYLIPRIASQAEDHRKARDIQTSLVQDMSQSIAQVVLTGQLLATRSIKKENANGQATFNDALLTWEVDKATIRARLEAYFAKAKVTGQSLPDAWGDYSGAVEDLYYLSTTELPDRCGRTKGLIAYLHVSASLRCRRAGETGAELGAACRKSTSWNALALCDEDSLKRSGEGYKRGVNYFTAYRAAAGELLGAEVRVIDAIRTSTPAGF